jgi:hypothetical protein
VMVSQTATAALHSSLWQPISEGLSGLCPARSAFDDLYQAL